MKKSRYQKNNAYFKRIFKISLIVSLFFMITLFYLWPRFTALPFHRSAELKVDIFVSDIPVTRQPEKRMKPPPLRPNGFIPVPGNETELPDEIAISGSGENTLLGEIPSGLPAEIPAKPILEIYPQVSGVTCKGTVRLLLLVNKSGRVTEVEMVENTTASQECLELAREAAKKSEWLPARANGKEVDSWVIKVFKFNTKE
jgi:outer membrane biosynthesis protein TonB